MAYLSVAGKLFFNDYFRARNTRNAKSNSNDIKELVRERIDAELDSINPYFNWDFESVNRRKFIKDYFNEYVKQLKERVENL
ncbi:MAG: hypothetical protein JXN64_06240 [Spirochaetes bacterium]|nr:hypothetical protein [Spirochaetota bacterium]